MEFLKSSGLALNPAGYLISSETNKPVNHMSFVKAQYQADYLVRLASAIKGKTFTHSKLDDLEAIKDEVRKAMNNTNMSYGTAPVKPVGDLTSKLADEAMAFVNFDKTQSKFNQINEFMQQFNSIRGVEECGDYFFEGVVKLNKIHSISDIQSAVEATIDILG